MKRILAMLMVLVLAFSVVACSDGIDPEAAAKEAEESATETVEAFMDAYKELDADKMAKLVIDEDDLPEGFQISKDEAVETAMAELPEMFIAYEQEFEEIIVSLFDKAFKEVSYEITETEKEDEEEFLFTVEVTVPDVEAVNFEELLSEEVSEDMIMELVSKYLESGEITLASTEEELMAVMMPDIIKIVEDVYSTIEFETMTKEIEVVVKLEDDEWLIDAKDSDWGDLAE